MESELSAKYYSHSDDKSDRFIGRKRNSKNVKENYLFRRVLNGKTNGRYEEMANSYYNMMAFNWEDERLLRNRASILNNLNASAFWFYVCSMYFPFCQNEFLTENKSEFIPETFNKILDRIILNKKNLKKKSYINTKFKFLNDIKSFYEEEQIKNEIGEPIQLEQNSKTNEVQSDVKTNEVKLDMTPDQVQATCTRQSTIDSYIDRMETCLTLLNNRNNSLFKTLTNDLKENEGKFFLTNGKKFNYEADDVLIDLKYLNSYSKKFQNYLIKKHEDKPYLTSNSSENGKKSAGCILSRLEEEELNNNPDDIVCVICNDGDYEDDDLIVYCSSCQMTVHQSCYGIVVLPKEDWICHPCTAFGLEKSKLIQCVCCPVKGGAMKPSTLKKSNNFFIYVNNLRQKDEKDFNIKSNHKPSKANPSADQEFKSTSQKKFTLNFNQENIKESLFNENFSMSAVTIRDNEHEHYNEHEQFKLNKNNNLILNENKSVNQIANFLFDTNKTKTDKEFSDLNSSLINESESKKTSASVMNLKSKKRGRQKKTGKNRNKNKSQKEESTQVIDGKINTESISNSKIFYEYAWIHLSCALWTPEIIIQDFQSKDEIKNIESIDKKRFQEKCNICGLSSHGPTVKCENEKCQIRFHVECARINKYQLEMMNNSLNDFKYYIYCQIHRPHRLIKNIELRRHRAVDDIGHFQQILAKNYEILSKFDKRNEFTVFVSRKTGGISEDAGAKRQIFENQNKNKIKFLSKKLKAKLLHVIRGLAKRVSNINIIVKKIKPETETETGAPLRDCINTQDMLFEPAAGELTCPVVCYDIHEDNTNYQIKNVKERINLTYSDTLNPKFFPWYMIKGFSNLSPYDLYRIYMTELVPDEYHYAKLILKKNFEKKNPKKSLSKRKKIKRIAGASAKPAIAPFNDQNFPSIVNSEEIFCYCRKPCNACKYGDEVDNKCVLNGWVHKECAEELRDLDKTTIEDENFVFICNGCRAQYESNEIQN